MNILKSQAHAQGYSEGYHAAERDLYREIDALRKDKERLERERDEAREEAEYWREVRDPWGEFDGDISFPWE